MKKSLPRKQRIVKHLGKVSLAVLSIVLATPQVQAAEIDTAAQVLGTEGGKKAFEEVLKLARTKPSLSVAAGITCLACIPVAGVVSSPTMCIACGILLGKVLG